MVLLGGAVLNDSNGIHVVPQPVSLEELAALFNSGSYPVVRLDIRGQVPVQAVPSRKGWGALRLPSQWSSESDIHGISANVITPASFHVVKILPAVLTP